MNFLLTVAVICISLYFLRFLFLFLFFYYCFDKYSIVIVSVLHTTDLHFGIKQYSVLSVFYTIVKSIAGISEFS